MSEEQLKAFCEAIQADTVLQQKLQGITDPDAIVAIAKEAGFSISADELKKAQSEISEDQLEGVAGGGLAAVAGWAVLNLVTAGIPAMIDLANGSPYAKEALNSKY